MLKHDEDSETQTRPAAQVRVTPEELALALSRIEARKDAGQRNVDGTISIGEAVQQLGVDTTPEEVLAEVQTIRQEPTISRKRRPFVGQRLALLSGVGLGLIGLIGWWSIAPHASQSKAPPAAAITLPAPQAPPMSITVDPHLVVGDTSGKSMELLDGKIVELSEVGDNQPVLCGYVYGTFEPYSNHGSGPFWTIVKHQGQVYVRGWMSQTAQQVRQKKGADVEQDSSPVFSIPVTLPLNGFQVVPKEDDRDEFHAMNVHLDKHAYEKWEP